MSIKKKVLSMSGLFVAGVLAGSVLMYDNSVYHAVNDALGKGAVKNSVIQINGGTNLSGPEIEEALKAVQSARASILENQLDTQLKQVKERNDKIAELNALNAQLLITTAEGKLNSTASDKPIELSEDAKAALLNSINSNGLELEGEMTVNELQKLSESVKNSIDSQSNAQQMEMLRLQSLSNKRNEAFDVMTNFIKKMQDSRSSIIGNMR